MRWCNKVFFFLHGGLICRMAPYGFQVPILNNFKLFTVFRSISILTQFARTATYAQFNPVKTSSHILLRKLLSLQRFSIASVRSTGSSRLSPSGFPQGRNQLGGPEIFSIEAYHSLHDSGYAMPVLRFVMSWDISILCGWYAIIA